MRLKDLPASDNVEDRRKEKPQRPLQPRKTLAQMLAEGDKRPLVKSDPTTKLARDAGVDDVK